MTGGDALNQPEPGQQAASIAAVAERLRRYGSLRYHNKDDPLDELIFIVLSAQTEGWVASA
jgi:hypothetical protein